VHVHGWSPECGRGTHGIAIIVKQWQHGNSDEAGHVHSEQRCLHPFERQQNHSPDVEQPVGQPPPCEHGLQRYSALLQRGSGDQQAGLHGPPPQPAHLGVSEPSETSVPVRKSPAPSELADMNLKNWRRDERRARALDALVEKSTGAA
jgi:hypothetical protein